MTIPFLEWTDEQLVEHRQPVIDKIFIGRGCKGLTHEKCLMVQDAVVSRDHAVISRNGAALELIDMSKNGTWLNDVRLTPGALVTLKDGDTIVIGSMSIQVSYPVTNSPIASSNRWDDATTITPTLTCVTHLIADVRGFSTLAQAYDSNRAYKIMNEIIQIFSQIIYNFKGTIKDYAGDAVFAFWPHSGTPESKLTLLACQAAIEQAKAIERMSSDTFGGGQIASPVRMGWGISTGSATISHYGDRPTDLAVVGDATNLAFRLAGLANKLLPAEIIICEKTAEMVNGVLPLEDLGLVHTKGRVGEEHVFAISAAHLPDRIPGPLRK